MDPPEISVIIPVRNEARMIEETLDQLADWGTRAEIIVVDGGSSDGTADMAAKRCDRVFESRPGRALQMNLGAAHARGRYLFFLHADTRIECSPEQVMEELADSPDWGFFAVSLSGPGIDLRVIEWFMNLRSRWTDVATGDQLLFVRKEIFEREAGFAEIPLMEDIEICKRLRRQSPARALKLMVTTSSRRWRDHGTPRTVLTMWILRLAYWLGVSPQRLASIYYGR